MSTLDRLQTDFHEAGQDLIVMDRKCNEARQEYEDARHALNQARHNRTLAARALADAGEAYAGDPDAQQAFVDTAVLYGERCRESRQADWAMLKAFRAARNLSQARQAAVQRERDLFTALHRAVAE